MKHNRDYRLDCTTPPHAYTSFKTDDKGEGITMRGVLYFLFGVFFIFFPMLAVFLKMIGVVE